MFNKNTNSTNIDTDDTDDTDSTDIGYDDDDDDDSDIHNSFYKNSLNGIQGIPTMGCFNDFWKKIYNLFIYKKYLDSDTKKNNGSLNEFKKLNSVLVDLSEDPRFYTSIGGEFIACLITIRLLKLRLSVHPKNLIKATHYLTVEKNIRVELLKNNLNLVHTPQKLPMVCEPEPKDYIYSKDLTKNKLGGYLLNDEMYTNSLIKPRVRYEKPTTIESEVVVNLVNGVSKIPFKINTDTLDYIYRHGIYKKILI
jgi:hypothetical protein